MNATKFVVRLNRTGNRAPEYVQRVDPTPIQITKNRKRALIMRASQIHCASVPSGRIASGA